MSFSTPSPIIHLRIQPTRLLSRSSKSEGTWATSRPPYDLQNVMTTHPRLHPGKSNMVPHFSILQEDFPLSSLKAWKDVCSIPVMPFIGDICFITQGRRADQKPWVQRNPRSMSENAVSAVQRLPGTPTFQTRDKH